MMRFLLFLFISINLCYAQDSTYTRKVINDLCSPGLAGRGYVNKGIEGAANYINNQYKDVLLKPFKTNSFSQFFKSSINSFPGNVSVSVNGKKLVPGVHYLVSAESKGIKGKYLLSQKDSITFSANDMHQDVPLFVVLKRKLTHSVSIKQENYTVIELLRDSVLNPREIEVEIESKFIKEYKMQNIAGYVKGKTKPDSFIVFTAHYDHLGMMGSKTYFPGANDNASGISMLLNLMNYFKQHPQDYSIAFICFAGEEAGLLGSEYYVKNPLFPLKSIRFLINLDLLGTGEEGITVVNATEFKKEFELLKKINADNKLLTGIKPRGKAMNSDHYWFSERGVPCFFIYTMGGIKAYHDVYDVPKTLPLTAYREVFKLLTTFVVQLQ